MTLVADLDDRWLAANPVPSIDPDGDKNARGRVLVVGGAEFVPGALRLTGEAALRVGAGKLQLATVASVASALGVLVPEAAMTALPVDADGEIDSAASQLLQDLIARCDTLVLGPGMSESEHAGRLVQRLLSTPRDDLSIVLDAGAICSLRDMEETLQQHQGRVIITPHYGECAALTHLSVDEIKADAPLICSHLARQYRSIIFLKGAQSFIAMPDGKVLQFRNECPGLATSGSGDVLAGAIGGLLARGARAEAAAAWGAWLHGAAGRAASKECGGIGFLARDLLPLIPQLLNAKLARCPEQ
jgi:ADP-dependent NAD(P)H-hydrate dehydratase